MSSSVIVWFRRDLRLADHPALGAAVETGAPVIPVFVLDTADGPWRPGAASRWWLHHSLAALDASLRERGSTGLVLRCGNPVDAIASLAEESGANEVYFTRRYAPREARLEQDLADRLDADGRTARRFGGALLMEPESEALRTKAGAPYSVFTPFYKALMQALPEPQPQPAPEHIPAPPDMPHGDRLEDWDLLPTKPDWAGGLRQAWTPGEAAALERLDEFLDGAVADYPDDRDRPDRRGTSRLSPHLHFGEISPRTVWHRTSRAIDSDGRTREAKGGASFLRELVWREFAHHVLHHRPELPDTPLRPEFADFPWEANRDALRAWQRGRTGYPIVDAGMRELWTTGWMHNRVRMIVASFLIKDLLIPWQEGAAWFWDTLVDADLANNAAGWQWVAGSGVDSAPFFRVFNPVLQSERFDPDGDYVRRWIPELAELPTSLVHKPWDAGTEALDRAGVVLGEDYPHRIVDHGKARRRALAAFEEIRGS